VFADQRERLALLCLPELLVCKTMATAEIHEFVCVWLSVNLVMTHRCNFFCFSGIAGVPALYDILSFSFVTRVGNVKSILILNSYLKSGIGFLL